VTNVGRFSTSFHCRFPELPEEIIGLHVVTSVVVGYGQLTQCLLWHRTGFRGDWAVSQGPPQLRSLHKKVNKIITQGNIKILFETDDQE